MKFNTLITSLSLIQLIQMTCSSLDKIERPAQSLDVLTTQKHKLLDGFGASWMQADLRPWRVCDNEVVAGRPHPTKGSMAPAIDKIHLDVVNLILEKQNPQN